MVGRAARLLLRLAGWLLTPVVLTIAAALGATIGAMVAFRMAPTGALVLMAVCALGSALAGLFAWERLLRRSPGLRAVLAVTTEGVPEPGVVEALIGGHAAPAEDTAP